MVKTFKIIIYLGLIFQLSIMNSCFHKKEKDSFNVIDSLIIEYYTMKNTVFSNTVSDKNCHSNLVDSLVINNKILRFKNFEKENISAPTNLFTNNYTLSNIESFDTRENSLIHFLQSRLMSDSISNLLFQKQILGNLYKYYSLEELKNISYPHKLKYSNLYDTYVLFIEKDPNNRVFYSNHMLLINLKENKIKSIVDVSSFVSGDGNAYKITTRTNRKYFFVKTEYLFSDSLPEENPIETMPFVPKNIEFYTQFYFDKDGYVKFVEE